MAQDTTASEQAGRDEGSEPGDFIPRPMLAPWPQAPESAFGARVQLARTHYRLNVEALSRLTKSYDEPDRRGVSGAAISRYEANDALPGAREFRLIAQALGVSADWLLFGTLAVSGKTEAQQRFIASLIEVIVEQKDDVNIGGVSQSHILEYQAQLERRHRIAEARKPG